MSAVNKMGNEKLDVIKNPFAKKRISELWIRFAPEMFSHEWKATGTLKFQNGNTKGEQRFEGDSVDEIIIQMKKVIESL